MNDTPLTDREEHHQADLAYWAGLSEAERRLWLDQAEKFVDGLQNSRKARQESPTPDRPDAAGDSP